MNRVGRPAGDAKDKVVTALIQLVVRQGFAATSIDQICGAANVSKGAFFHHFKNKNEAVVAALDIFFDQRMAAQASYLEGSAAALDRVLRQIAFVTTPAATKYQGCLLGVMALESGLTHPDLSALCTRLFDRWIGEFAQDLMYAAPRLTEQQATQAARAFIATIEGGLMMTRCGADLSYLRDALCHFKAQLEVQLRNHGGFDAKENA